MDGVSGSAAYVRVEAYAHSVLACTSRREFVSVTRAAYPGFVGVAVLVAACRDPEDMDDSEGDGDAKDSASFVVVTAKRTSSIRIDRQGEFRSVA